MNIYITKENEIWLREQSNSMSGIINALLNEKRQYDTATPNLKSIPTKSLNTAQAVRQDKTASDLFSVPLSKATLLADIRSLEAERDAETEYNQDPSEVNKIKAKYQSQLDALWAQYKQ